MTRIFRTGGLYRSRLALALALLKGQPLPGLVHRFALHAAVVATHLSDSNFAAGLRRTAALPSGNHGRTTPNGAPTPGLKPPVGFTG
jgi:hypothetical protein